MQTDTLANCVYQLRAETGQSLSTTQGQNAVATLNYLLKRTQLELWTGYQWPTLAISGDLQMVAGQYIYDYPSPFSFAEVRQAYTAQANAANWRKLTYGMDETFIKPGGANSQSGDNPQFWRTEQAQFRVWPTPVSSNYWVRFRGMTPLQPFLADTDVSTLDATALVLFTAAELLARAKSQDAGNKLKKAQVHLFSLLGNSISAKRRTSTLGSSAQPAWWRQRTPGLDYIPLT